MDILKSIMVAASGLRAQSSRMRIIAENIANADSVASQPGGDPYRRKVPTFRATFDRELGAQVVRTGPVLRDQSDFGQRYEPGHPAANEQGYIQTPNVNSMVESMDMREAQRTYQANLNVINTTRQMVLRTLDILRS
ncbi:MAG: flagellar basal body rod protein FlgC [Pseudomonadota bacterium]